MPPTRIKYNINIARVGMAARTNLTQTHRNKRDLKELRKAHETRQGQTRSQHTNPAQKQANTDATDMDSLHVGQTAADNRPGLNPG